MIPPFILELLTRSATGAIHAGKSLAETIQAILGRAEKLSYPLNVETANAIAANASNQVNNARAISATPGVKVPLNGVTPNYLQQFPGGRYSYATIVTYSVTANGVTTQGTIPVMVTSSSLLSANEIQMYANNAAYDDKELRSKYGVKGDITIDGSKFYILRAEYVVE